MTTPTTTKRKRTRSYTTGTSSLSCCSCSSKTFNNNNNNNNNNNSNNNNNNNKYYYYPLVGRFERMFLLFIFLFLGISFYTGIFLLHSNNNNHYYYFYNTLRMKKERRINNNRTNRNGNSINQNDYDYDYDYDYYYYKPPIAASSSFRMNQQQSIPITTPIRVQNNRNENDIPHSIPIIEPYKYENKSLRIQNNNNKSSTSNSSGSNGSYSSNQSMNRKAYLNCSRVVYKYPPWFPKTDSLNNTNINTNTKNINSNSNSNNNNDYQYNYNETIVQDMVYWQNIPSDWMYVSPYKKRSPNQRNHFLPTTTNVTMSTLYKNNDNNNNNDNNKNKNYYITFELDIGGWNNVRMAFETVVVLALAMGRILVLPPIQQIYLLSAELNTPSDNNNTVTSINTSSSHNNHNVDFTTTTSLYEIFELHKINTRYQQKDDGGGNGIQIITMEEFLQKEVRTGNIRNRYTGDIITIPHRRTTTGSTSTKVVPTNTTIDHWDYCSTSSDCDILFDTLFETEILVKKSTWNVEVCVAVFSSVNSSLSSSSHTLSLQERFQEAIQKAYLIDSSSTNTNTNTNNNPNPNHTSDYSKKYIGHPTPVHGDSIERLLEIINGRTQLCIYPNNKNSSNNSTTNNNVGLEQEQVLHFVGGRKIEQLHNGRLLTPFYAFVYMEEWKHDLILKRFVRDNIRYSDTIQCAAARIVTAIREYATTIQLQPQHQQNLDCAKGDIINDDDDDDDDDYSNSKSNNNNNNKNKTKSKKNMDRIVGTFDAFHVRRGEFQYKKTKISSQEMYDISKDLICDGSIVYIATDIRPGQQRDHFFLKMKQHYDLLFLDDFMYLLHGIHPNLYGMIEQLVASQARIFFGCWFSTFTSYINRIRGYHVDMQKKQYGYQYGIIPSYYYALPEHKMKMRQYYPISGMVYAREYPIGWRNIDQGIPS